MTTTIKNTLHRGRHRGPIRRSTREWVILAWLWAIPLLVASGVVWAVTR